MKKRFTHTGTSTTNNQKATSKLRLSRETLRSLGAPELARVAGGDVPVGDTHDTCWPTCVDTKA
jgi:hypothetical protein